MIKEQALVKKLQGDYVIVEVQRQSGCQGCNLNASCGMGSFGRLFGVKQKPISIHNDINLKTGDKVIIGIPEKGFVLSSFLIYLFPLFCLFLFSILADVLFNSQDILNGLAAIVGLVIGLLVSAVLSKHKLVKTIQPQLIQQIW